MSRLFAAVTVVILMLLAVMICLRQTLAHSEELGSAGMPLFVIEVTIAGGLITSIPLLLRRRPSRKNTFASREGFAVAQPLRRLLAAVWS